MHPNYRRPMYVPAKHAAMLDKMSKADLMDLIWSLTKTDLDDPVVGVSDDDIASYLRPKCMYITVSQRAAHRVRPYVGLYEGRREYFKCRDYDLTTFAANRGYMSVIGPFVTVRAARFCAVTGSSGLLQSVADYERIARQHANRTMSDEWDDMYKGQPPLRQEIRCPDPACDDPTSFSGHGSCGQGE